MFYSATRSIAATAARRAATRRGVSVRWHNFECRSHLSIAIPYLIIIIIINFGTNKLQSMAVRAATASSGASKLASIAFVGATAVMAYQNDNTSKFAVQCDAIPVQGVPGTNLERTFLAVKPDGVQRGLIGDIIARFEKRGYKVWNRIHIPINQVTTDNSILSICGMSNM